MPKEQARERETLIRNESTSNHEVHEVIRGIPEDKEVYKYGMTPEAELFPTPPSEIQQPAPENKKAGGDKK